MARRAISRRIQTLLEQRTLTGRLLFGFAGMILTVLLVGSLGIRALGQVNAELRSLFEVEVRGITQIKEVQLHMALASRAVRQAVLERTRSGRDSVAMEAAQWMERATAGLPGVRGHLATDDRERLLKLETSLSVYRQQHERVLRFLEADRVDSAQALVASSLFLEPGRLIDDVLSDLSRIHEAQVWTLVDQTSADTRWRIWTEIALLLAATLISLGLAVEVSRSIRVPLDQLREAIERLAQGHLDVTVPYAERQNELGQLARSVIVLQGKARELDSQSGLKALVADIAGRMQGADSLESLCQEFLDLVTPRLQAVLSSVYLLDEDRPVLRCRASVGLVRGEIAQPLEFDLGEGLIGYCAQTGERMTLDRVPPGYLPVRSGTGEASAGYVELWPLANADGVQAVVEFAFFTPPSPQAQALLTALLPILGRQLETQWRARQTEKLLARTQEHEESLRITEAWYRSVIESAPDGILVVDNAGLITLANASAEAMFGFDRFEILGVPFNSLLPNAGGGGIAGGASLELTAKRGDAVEFPVEIGFALLPELGEKGSMVCVSIRDISVRKQTEEVLAQQRATMQNILDSSPVAMAFIAEDALRYVNPEFSRLFGATTGDPVDRVGFFQALQPEIQTRLTTGQSLQGIEFTTPKADGQMGHFLSTYSLIDLNGIEGIAGWIIDISERARVEQLKKEFISTVSHELRTPLTSIRGSLALVVNGVLGQLPEAIKPLVEIAHGNCERLILLVNDILDMEKLAAGRMDFDIQPSDIIPLIRKAVEANRGYAQQHQVEIAFGPMEAEAVAAIDANRLLQVFANLLSNAAKFSPAGERVTIGVHRVGDRLRIEVSDRGPGIPEAFRDRIFQKFAQADSSDTRKKGGTGLGLNITKAIVERMGGTIGFTSEPNIQTTFHVELPAVSDASSLTSGNSHPSEME
jgi:PAS domain S-box-containing protein